MTDTVNQANFCALQSIDFCSEDLNMTDSSMLLFPFAPSWSRGNASSAAYSIKDTTNAVVSNELKIRARFQYDTDDDSTNNGIVRLNIRAISVPTSEKTSLEKKIVGDYPGQDVLGEVESREVIFDSTGRAGYNGDSNIPLTIKGAKFSELGVGVYDIAWAWEYQELEWDGDQGINVPASEWIEFDRSSHRIFLTLEIPKSPWTAYPFREIFQDNYSQTPVWTEALLWACKWAQGSKTIVEAGKAIADELFKSGRFKYFSESKYSTLQIEADEEKLELADNTISFYLSKIIERLEGGMGLGEEINCVDSALIVATLTNIIGGNLQIGKFQGSENMNYYDSSEENRFEVKEIQAIGSDIESTMNMLSSDDKHYFSYHTIAWMPPQLEGSNAEPNQEEIRAMVSSGEVEIAELAEREEVVPEFDNSENIIFDACLNFSTDGTDENTVSCSGLKIEDYRMGIATDSDEGYGKCIPQQVTIQKVRVV
jgi:hypothetical protein